LRTPPFLTSIFEDLYQRQPLSDPKLGLRDASLDLQSAGSRDWDCPTLLSRWIALAYGAAGVNAHRLAQGPAVGVLCQSSSAQGFYGIELASLQQRKSAGISSGRVSGSHA
jgi:hypothetical protein